MAIAHAEIKNQLGQTVWVHKCCVENATLEVRKITAQQKELA
jgi:hypothetical protein